ncbi:hypothetical protein [Candidatus Phytoplasma tritici]|uniref:hypothetical protein n=1 Tax=Candidatus Phytoplasma tritici TaxID=321961 RepID=UPI000415937D|nr:hypothetical protein [Candidatus Phytoplasma tritici]
MENNNQQKSKNMIFIIWGLFISTVILVLLIILLLAVNKPQTRIETQKQQHLKFKTDTEKDKTYNRLINKKEKEADKLTPQPESSKSNLEYPNTIIKLPDGFEETTEYNQDTGKKLKVSTIKESTNFITKIIYFDENEKYSKMYEYDQDTGFILTKTYYNPDGTIKQIICY